MIPMIGYRKREAFLGAPRKENDRMRSIFPLVIAITMIFSGSMMVLWSPEDVEGKLSDGSALTTRSPVLINGNSEFTSANGVSSGTGSSSDPYIIEDWKISAASSDGITIRDTDKHFIIRNCWIMDGMDEEEPRFNTGINLDNVENGIITYCLLENNGKGVMGSGSDRITLYNNTCSGNSEGMGFHDGSRNITIRNNHFDSNGVGVELRSDTDLCLVANNSISRSGGAGIYIDFECEDNIIEYNDCLDTYSETTPNDHSGTGVRVRMSSRNIISM